MATAPKSPDSLSDAELIAEASALAAPADMMIEDSSFIPADAAEMEALRAENEALKAELEALRVQLSESEGFAETMLSSPESQVIMDLEKTINRLQGEMGEVTKKEQAEAERIIRQVLGDDFIDRDTDGKGLDMIEKALQGKMALEGEDLSQEDVSEIVLKVKEKLGWIPKKESKGVIGINNASDPKGNSTLLQRWFNQV